MKRRVSNSLVVSACVVLITGLLGVGDARGQATSCPFSPSGAAKARATVDGLLLARFARGLRGTALTGGIAAGQNLSTAEQYVRDNILRLDVDGDEEFTERDATLIVRYLSGYKPSALTSGVQFARNSKRRTDAQIEDWINAGCASPITIGNIFYVRTDGGNVTQCDGRANVAYPGSGTNQACAWNSPAMALPIWQPSPSAVKPAPRIAGGDTLIIGSGDYKIGLGGPGGENCPQAAAYDCVMVEPPSGTAARPTRILGAGYDNACPAPPQLWGTQRTLHVMSIQGASHVQLGCLDITDRSSCIELAQNSSDRCVRDSFPHGDWASVGLTASDSSNILLKDVHIRGIANRGIVAGRIRDWTAINFSVIGNGWAGWEGDIGENNSSNSGTLYFRNLAVEWNGCAEIYPRRPDLPEPQRYRGCVAQEGGGYGDGLGAAFTAGDWIFENSRIRHNTSDGMDLLYHNRGGKIILDRVLAEGNAGNQIKVLGDIEILNSVIIGNCAYFNSRDSMTSGDDCRGAGAALSSGMEFATDSILLANNTIISQGDTIMTAAGRAGNVIRLRNNILIGVPKWNSPTQNSADLYDTSNENTPQAGTPVVTVDEINSIKQNARNVLRCNQGENICTTNAGLVNSTVNAFNPRLLATSPARDSGVDVPGLGTLDALAQPRKAGVKIDRGAVEYQP